MNETKYTSGPWHTGALMSRVEVLPNGWNVSMCIADCDAKHSPDSEDEKCANAAFIVRACNSHKALLDACIYTLTLLLENVGQKTHAVALLEDAIALAEKGEK